MSDDPVRIHDGDDAALTVLRSALHEAREQTPDAFWHERMANRIEDALRGGHAEAPSSSEDDAADSERLPWDFPPVHREVVTSESNLSENTPDLVETEVADGLTAGLLAAGAALAWLRRRVTRRPLDDDDN